MKGIGFRTGILTTVLLGLLYACGGDDLKTLPTVAAKKITLIKERSYDVDLTYSDSAYVKAKGFATVLDKVTPSMGAAYSEMPKGVKIEFFDQLMHKTGTITSNYAINKGTEKITIFRKNVVVVSDKLTFNTEELTWDENKKLYSSPAGTVTGKDGEIITGTEFSAPQDFSTYKIIQAAGSTYIKGDLTQ